MGFVTHFGEECLIWGSFLESVVHFGANSVILGEITYFEESNSFPEGPVWDSILWGRVIHSGGDFLVTTTSFGVSTHFGGEPLISGRDQPFLGHHLILRSIPPFWGEHHLFWGCLGHFGGLLGGESLIFGEHSSFWGVHH